MEEIEREAGPYTMPTRRVLGSAPNAFFNKADKLVDAGKLPKAWRYLVDDIWNAPTIERAWRFLYMQRIHHLEGSPRPNPELEGLDLLQWAVLCARMAYDGKSKSQIVTIWDEIVLSCLVTRQTKQAHKYLREALQQLPDAGRLWYRLGVMRFAERDHVAALAAFTTALRYRANRIDVLAERGHLLSRWGNPKEAIRDINEVLASQPTPTRIIQMRCALAVSLFRDSKARDGITELVEAEEQMPAHPWVSYYIALLLLSLAFEVRREGGTTDDGYALDMEVEARKRYAHALDFQRPALTGEMRRRAEQQLRLIDEPGDEVLIETLLQV
jgi:tetratricopeptide (TPR) repeat protein